MGSESVWGVSQLRLKQDFSKGPKRTLRSVGAPACPHLCVTHALGLGHLVGEIRLLKARGAHALVHGRVGAGRRVWRVQACLDQGFARFTGDHGLEFSSGKGVDMTRFTGHEQQNLGSRQGGEFVRLGRDKARKM